MAIRIAPVLESACSMMMAKLRYNSQSSNDTTCEAKPVGRNASNHSVCRTGSKRGIHCRSCRLQGAGKTSKSRFKSNSHGSYMVRLSRPRSRNPEVLQVSCSNVATNKDPAKARRMITAMQTPSLQWYSQHNDALQDAYLQRKSC